MTTVLVDRDVEGHVERIWEVLAAEGWLDFVSLQRVTFDTVGLLPNSPDRLVWRFAQAQGMLLLTNNRNAKGKDSLELTISEESSPTSLPVLTIGNVDRLADREYRLRCATGLVEVALYPERYVGTGRIFIP